MKYWSTKRKASLVIHSIIASIILVWSLDASVMFWQSLYKDNIFAYGTVAVIDCMTLLGMILFILKINSPIQWLRHLLPFVSVLPLWSELQMQFARLDSFYQYALTTSITIILVGLAWLTWHTIENLFIDPIEAAGEAFQSQLDVVGRTLIQLRDANERLKSFQENIVVMQHDRSHPQPTAQPALPESSQDSYLDAYNNDPDAVIIKWRDEEKVSFEEIGRRLQITRQSATARYNHAKQRVTDL